MLHCGWRCDEATTTGAPAHGHTLALRSPTPATLPSVTIPPHSKRPTLSAVRVRPHLCALLWRPCSRVQHHMPLSDPPLLPTSRCAPCRPVISRLRPTPRELRTKPGARQSAGAAARTSAKVARESAADKRRGRQGPWRPPPIWQRPRPRPRRLWSRRRPPPPRTRLRFRPRPPPSWTHLQSRPRPPPPWTRLRLRRRPQPP